MTPQEIFDASARAVIQQGQPAFAGGGCCYDTSDLDGRGCGVQPRRCAVGVLMNDHEIATYGTFSGSIEGLCVTDATRPGGSVLRSFFHEENLLLHCIQVAHDDHASYAHRSHDDLAEWRGDFCAKMYTVAVRFHLSPAVLLNPQWGTAA